MPPDLEEPEPLIGPVAYCPALDPPGGTGTLNGVPDGRCTVFGVIAGLTDGLDVGGCGLAACGFGIACCTCGAG